MTDPSLALTKVLNDIAPELGVESQPSDEILAAVRNDSFAVLELTTGLAELGVSCPLASVGHAPNVVALAAMCDVMTDYGLGDPDVDEMSLVPGPSHLTGRWVRLRPPTGTTAELQKLYALSVGSSNSIRWRYRGTPVPFDQFVGQFWTGVLTQYVVDRLNAPSDTSGLVVAYQSDLVGGHAHIAGLMEPGPPGSGAEAFLLLLHHLFKTFPLHKIYVEIPAFNIPQVGFVLRAKLREEGRLQGHVFFDGCHWDQHIFAAYRDRFVEQPTSE